MNPTQSSPAGAFDPRPQYQSAIQALNRGEWPQAKRLASDLLSRIPPHAGVHFVIGVAELNMQCMPGALKHLHKAVELNPARPDYGAQLAKALAAGRFMRQALAAADAAALQNPSDPMTADTLGIVYTQGNQHAKALPLFQLAVKLAPQRASHRFNLATSLTFAGRLEDAEVQYEACISHQATYWKAHLALAKLRHVDAGDNHLARLEGLLSQWSGRENRAEMYLNLAISKELEDIGDYSSSFERLAAGKDAGRRGRGYHPDKDAKLFDALIEAFPIQEQLELPDAGSTQPIFVIGMPRTGTTLVDRILSSHSQVYSAGELQNFSVVLKRASGSMTSGLLDIDTVRRAADLPWRELGDAYVDSTRPATGRLPRFTDKLPHNFLNVGFIGRALQNAHIICVRRNPMDTCLGNFRQLFAQGTPFYDYSFDLLETGRYYLLFDKLMRHWHSSFPGRIMEVQYEALVDNQEATSRSLIEFCGLEWEEACMRFNENPEPVATASAVQVRQPIHRDALQRWKQFQPQLAGLRTLLEDGGIKIT